MTSARVNIALAIAAAFVVAAGACSGKVAPAIGSETNWVGGCTSDGECVAGHCVCGLCTETCADNAPCPGVGAAQTCVRSMSNAFASACAGVAEPPSGICLHSCASDGDCRGAFRCESGACVPLPSASGSTASVTSTSTTVFDTSFGWRQENGPLAGYCLPMAMNPAGPAGDVVQWRDAPCDCNEPGLAPADSTLLEASRAELRRNGGCDADGGPPCDGLCGCAVQSMTGAALTQCREQETALDPSAVGFCYVDATTGNPSLLKDCPSNELQILRFNLPNAPQWLATIHCTGSTGTSVSGQRTGAMGAPCIPANERDPSFPGYQVTEIDVEDHAPECATGVCLVNNFKGRVSCTYGQTDLNAPTCRTPDTRVPVTVTVDPQLMSRRPDKSVYCSCRCDGPPEAAPFCACPDGFECAKLVADIGTGNRDLVGSYCIKAGTRVDNPQDLLAQQPCAGTACGPPP